MPEAGGSRIFSLRRAKIFDHLKVGQSGRSVHGKDELGKEPEPEGGRSKACQRAVKDEVMMVVVVLVMVMITCRRS